VRVPRECGVVWFCYLFDLLRVACIDLLNKMMARVSFRIYPEPVRDAYCESAV
jgi:hypothetical protein